MGRERRAKLQNANLRPAAGYSLIVASLNIGWAGMALMPAVALALCGDRKFPGPRRGLGRGVFEFRRAARHSTDEIDGEAMGAGRSLGGIRGKSAAQALTPENRVAELHDPAVFQDKPQTRRHPRRGMHVSLKLRRWMRQLVLLLRIAGAAKWIGGLLADQNLFFGCAMGPRRFGLRSGGLRRDTHGVERAVNEDQGD